VSGRLKALDNCLYFGDSGVIIKILIGDMRRFSVVRGAFHTAYYVYEIQTYISSSEQSSVTSFSKRKWKKYERRYYPQTETLLHVHSRSL
jgi:hypothetical protein